MRWSGPWTIVGRTLGANRLLAGSACGKRHRVRPLNSVVRQHTKTVATIHTGDHIGELKAIAANYTVAVEDIIAVGSVQEWSQSRSVEERNPFRAAKVLQ